MKKRQFLLILAIGISFAPVVFAGEIGSQSKPDGAGQIFCQAGITNTKADIDSGSDTSGNQGSGKSTANGINE